MTVNSAKDYLVKGKRLGESPLPYLKWLSKNHIRKEVRDAAILVVNSRSVELNLGDKVFNPTYQPNPTPRLPEKIDFSRGAFGELKALLEAAPDGLF